MVQSLTSFSVCWRESAEGVLNINHCAHKPSGRVVVMMRLPHEFDLSESVTGVRDTLPWTKSQQDRQGQCQQLTQVTGSLMSTSSGRHIIDDNATYCLGVQIAHMTPTAQASRKSWYMSASRGKMAFARAGTPKENSRTTRLPFSYISVL